MREIADAVGIAIDDAALGAIAYRADGGLRDALTMLEQVAAFANGAIDVGTVDAAFGQTGREFARALRDATLDTSTSSVQAAAQALRVIDEASDAGADMQGLIRSTIGEFRHLLVARVNPELLARDLAEDDATAVRERAAVTPQARLVRALRLLADALAAARGSGNTRLELETAVLRFVLQGEDPTLDALAARVTALEAGEPAVRAIPAVDGPPAVSPLPAASTPARPAAPPRKASPAEKPIPTVPRDDVTRQPEPVEAPSNGDREAPPASRAAASALPPMELSVQKLRTLWSSVRTRAEEAKPSLNAALGRATVDALENDTVVLRIPIPPMVELVKRELPTLKKAIADVTGRALDVRIVSGAGAPPSENDAPSGGDDDDLMRYALEKLS
jgi:DNA polymerase-3 subunit gamma/tau